MYTRYEFLSVVRHTRTIPSEQLDDVDDSEDDSTETYDVEEVMALATINEAAPTTECLEYIWWPPSERLLRAVHWWKKKETKKCISVY